MKILRIVFIAMFIIGAGGFIVLGGTEGELNGILAGAGSVIALLALFWKQIVGLFKKTGTK